jgi:alkyl hydroperoxide reductase subunit AhpC
VFVSLFFFFLVLSFSPLLWCCVRSTENGTGLRFGDAAERERERQRDSRTLPYQNPTERAQNSKQQAQTNIEKMAANQPPPSLQQNYLRLGDTAPDFEADTTEGRIKFYDWIGPNKWAILFSHPRDFTPVCTTELGRAAQLKQKFEDRNTKIIALSVDHVDNHGKWLTDIDEIVGCKMNFPIIADPDRKISCLYGMLDQTHLAETGMPFTVRSVYIIGPDRKIKLMLTYPASTGRNFDEILRVLDSLQLAISHKVATPADWTKGKDVVVLPTVPTAEAKELFPKGVTEVRPWLRTTPDPSA